jgi:hypothetical protein
MTLAMVCRIVFHKNDRRDEIILNKVTEIEFESTFKETTSRGSLIMPRNVGYFNKHKVRDVFRKGDALTIYMGYDRKLIQEFTGYITEVAADIPITIKFEDEMFRIRQLPVNLSSPSITLEKLLKTIIPGYEVDVLEQVELGSVRLSQTQVGPVLDKIKSEWGFYTYVVGKKVICGKYYADDTKDAPVYFHLEKNCVSTSLNYKRADDIRIKFFYSSTIGKGQKISVEVGDKDFDVEVKAAFNYIKLKEELQKLAERDYRKAKVDRFDGSFTAFGIPSVRHGLKCVLDSSLYEDRTGHYFIEGVKKSFSSGGYRQEITLGEKVTL